MNKEELMKILPHRDNMLLVEEAEVVVEKDKDHLSARNTQSLLQNI